MKMNNALVVERSDSSLLTRNWVRFMVQVIVGSLLLALFSQIRILLPFTPVPVTLQSTCAIALGVALGPTRGLAAVMAYLLEGALGLPVFAGGTGSVLALVGPSGGYLFGFALAAWIGGVLGQGGGSLRLATAFLAGSLAIYASGLPVLAAYVGWKATWAAGVLVFLPGDVVKSLFFAALLRRWGRVVR